MMSRIRRSSLRVDGDGAWHEALRVTFQLRPSVYAAAGWSVLMLVAMSIPIPADTVPQVGKGFLNIPTDKLAHAGLFAIFAGLWSVALAGRKRWIAWVGISGAVFGGLTEAVQAIPWLHREADWEDLVADVAGVALGLLIFMVLRLLTRGTMSKAIPVPHARELHRAASMESAP